MDCICPFQFIPAYAKLAKFATFPMDNFADSSYNTIGYNQVFLKQNLFYQHILFMHEDLIQERAKEELNTLSLHDQLRNWQDQLNRPNTCHLKIPNIVTRRKEKAFRINNQCLSRANIKTPLVPNKVKFEDKQSQPGTLKNKSMVQARKKFSSRVLNATNQLDFQKSVDRMEVENIDLMKYWFRHRLKENSINTLITRIQQKRRSLREKLH